MRRLVLIAVLATTVIVAATAFAAPRPQAAAAPIPPLPTPSTQIPPLPPTAGPVQYVLRVGDTIRVDGGSLGCQVTRRSGRATIECRPSGALKGRYGTFLNNRTATVARYRSSRTAQVVFTAKHRGGYRVCGTSSRARQAAAGCR